MPQTINTNIASLNAQRNLNTSQSALNSALQRLSSGLRINSAKDDAAGLAIGSRMTSQINGLTQAIRNANDGISLAQTGEGALSEVTNNLQRIRELAIQASNSTNSASDRAAIDQEVQARLAEIDRTAAQTSFNGQKILDGSFGTAQFQVGANAGETIGISIATSMRTADIGTYATATSAALGATASGATIDLSPTSLLFGTAGTVDGRLEITASSKSFGEVGYATLAAPVLADLSGNAEPGHNIQTLTDNGTTLDFSGTVGQFDVSDGALTVGITLSADYSGDLLGLSTAINTQLGATASTVSTNVIDGKLVFQNSAGNLNTAVAITNTDAKMAASGFADGAGVAGAAAFGASFDVDGHTVSLSSNYTGDIDLLTSDIQAALNTAASGVYTVTNDGTDVTITNNLAGSSAVQITNRDLGAIVDLALVTGDVTNGTINPASNDAVFEVVATDGGTDQKATITLGSNYADFDAVATAIQTQLDADADTTGKFTVSNSGGVISIVRDDASEVVTIQNANAVATAAGFGNQAGVVTTNATFSVDGTAVTLDQDYGSNDLLAADIQSQLTGYTAVNNAGTITITNSTLGSSAVVVSGADANAVAAGIANATGTDGLVGGSISLAAGEFTITDNTGNVIDLAGDYDNTAALVDAINNNVSGVFASKTSTEALVLTSPTAITVGGTAATTTVGFSSTSFAADQGSLSAISVTTVANANIAINSIDSALTAVNGFRSTLGAIQNRFDSVIASLSTTSENLSASRSRIQDADFAAETANLTRAQILQQAGVAMLAQANALPQNVLSLLR